MGDWPAVNTCTRDAVRVYAVCTLVNVYRLRFVVETSVPSIFI